MAMWWLVPRRYARELDKMDLTPAARWLAEREIEEAYAKKVEIIATNTIMWVMMIGLGLLVKFYAAPWMECGLASFDPSPPKSIARRCSEDKSSE
jgi:hypothetical protein